jgi:hypothetical protein
MTQLIYSSMGMWKAILQVKDAVQNRGRNDDIMWAARQPKVMTMNCNHLGDWISTMFPSAKKQHTDAIWMRIAECQSIQESLYAQASASSNSQRFLPSILNPEEAANATNDLF